MVNIAQTAKRFKERTKFKVTAEHLPEPENGGFDQFKNHKKGKPFKSGQIPLTIQLVHQIGEGPNTGFRGEINFVGKEWGPQARRQPVVIAHADGRL